MKNLFAYDFTNNTIVASKATLKKAGNPTTPEYKALMKMIAEQPTFKVVEKTINTKSGKMTYKGLTIEMMESYINEQKNAVALCAEFESIRQFAKDSKRREYPLLKQWFVEKFKEQYKMTDAKKIHAKHVMAKATSKVVKLAPQSPQSISNQTNRKRI